MATHRVHDTGFPPAFDFRLVPDVLAAMERPRPAAVPLHPRRSPDSCEPVQALPPPRSQIEATLRQVEHWRQQILTRDLLQHYRELTVLRQRVETEQQTTSRGLGVPEPDAPGCPGGAGKRHADGGAGADWRGGETATTIVPTSVPFVDVCMNAKRQTPQNPKFVWQRIKGSGRPARWCAARFTV